MGSNRDPDPSSDPHAQMPTATSATSQESQRNDRIRTAFVQASADCVLLDPAVCTRPPESLISGFRHRRYEYTQGAGCEWLSGSTPHGSNHEPANFGRAVVRRNAFRISSRLRTVMLLPLAFSKYTTTFFPVPVAEGKTTLSTPSLTQVAAKFLRGGVLRPAKQRSTACSSCGSRLWVRSRIALGRDRQKIDHPGTNSDALPELICLMQEPIIATRCSLVGGQAIWGPMESTSPKLLATQVAHVNSLLDNVPHAAPDPAAMDTSDCSQREQ
jgi:hypothetical protein